MRALVVTNTYPPGDLSGVGTLVLELARRLHHDGHEVAVLTRRAAPDDAFAVTTGGPKLLFPLLVAWRYLRLPFASRADLVHLHESDGVLVACLLRLARVFGRPRGRGRLLATLQVSYVAERHAVRPVRDGHGVVSHPLASERRFAWLRAPVLALLGRITARLADAVIAPSKVTAGELTQDYGARVAAVIPNGVEPPATAAPARAGLGSPVILYGGRLRTRKAVAVLLSAFARLRPTHPEAQLVLVGDGPQRAALESQAASLGIADHVLFAGAVPHNEIAGWLAAADVFCLPSTYEGMPLAILEAMAHGKPVVATAVSGNPEAVADGDCGLLVPPEDADALASALTSLLDDPERRRTMGRRARQRVEERFSIARVVEAHLALLEGLVAAREVATEEGA